MIVAILVALILFDVLLVLSSPLPLWKRSTLYGRVSILDVRQEQFEQFKNERERDYIRFVLILFHAPFVWVGLIKIIS
jgi:hypothetical protein